LDTVGLPALEEPAQHLHLRRTLGHHQGAVALEAKLEVSVQRRKHAVALRAKARADRAWVG